MIILIIVITCVIIYMFLTYNSLVKKNNLVKESFSTMDIYLKKRWDLIPNLVETVKAYAKYEKETIMEVTKLRTNSYEKMEINKKIDFNDQIEDGICKIMAVAENYPQLKASENFINLSKSLTQIEDEIANSRKYYNGCVRVFNNQIEMFPSNLVAKMFGFKQAKMFEANGISKDGMEVKL